MFCSGSAPPTVEGSSLNVGYARSYGSDATFIDDGSTLSLLEDFKTNKTKSFELSDIIGHVIEFSSDKYGSRVIQQKLETATLEEKNIIFSEIFPHARPLMSHVFGNYVIQKFFEYGTEPQRRQLATQLKGHVLQLTLQMYGCRAIQKALEVVDVDQQTDMMHELEGSIMRCVRDQNGNYVIQKCIECVPRDKIMFLISSFFGHVVQLSTHPHSCRVIQRILKHCDDAETQRIMIAEIMSCIITLAQDQYGNYVIQHVLQYGNPEERSVIITKLAGQIVKMSQQKFAYKVVEKCLTFGTQEERQILTNEILGTTYENESLQVMVKDQFANYVVQKVLETCNEIHRQLILSRITTYLSILKKSNPAKYIILRIEKLISAGERTVALDWSDLEYGILGLIAKKLNDINEFAYFRAVCKRWKSASERIEDQPRVLPWYLQSKPIYHHYWSGFTIWDRNIRLFELSHVVPYHLNGKLHNSRDAKFFALHSSTVCKIHSDDMLYKHVEGFSERYLLMRDFLERSSYLFNPLTKTRILIPNFVPNWSGKSYIIYIGPNHNIDSVPANNYQILIIYFSVSRGREGEGDVEEEEVEVEEEKDGKGYVIVYAFTEFELVKKRKIRVPYSISVTYWNDKIFVSHYNFESDTGLETKVFSLVTGNQIYVITEEFFDDPFYTFNAGGFLMRVIEYTEKTEVYGLVESGTQAKWEKLLGIGDHVLFTDSYDRCLALKASDIGLKGNCMYGSEYRKGKYDIYRYDFDNNDRIVLACDLDFEGTWFVPSVY